MTPWRPPQNADGTVKGDAPRYVPQPPCRDCAYLRLRLAEEEHRARGYAEEARKANEKAAEMQAECAQLRIQLVAAHREAGQLAEDARHARAGWGEAEARIVDLKDRPANLHDARSLLAEVALWDGGALNGKAARTLFDRVRAFLEPTGGAETRPMSDPCTWCLDVIAERSPRCELHGVTRDSWYARRLGQAEARILDLETRLANLRAGLPEDWAGDPRRCPDCTEAREKCRCPPPGWRPPGIT